MARRFRGRKPAAKSSGPKRGRPESVRIGAIKVDGSMQVRVRIDDEAVAAYAERMEAGDKFPPLILYRDSVRTYWVADGFHRLAATKRLGKSEVSAQVFEGSREDAAWHALGANRTQGLRMTNADKERAVVLALELRAKESNRRIAEHVGVADQTVARHRAKTPNKTQPRCDIVAPETRIGRDGKRYPAKRGPINDDPPPSVDDDPPPPPIDDEPPPPVTDEPPPAEPADSADTAVDRVGTTIPSEAIAEAFRRDHEIVELCTAVNDIKSAVLHALDTHDLLFADLVRSQFEVACNNLRGMLDGARPHAVCPYCGAGGFDCRACRSRGWVNRITYQTAPAETKRRTRCA